MVRDPPVREVVGTVVSSSLWSLILGVPPLWKVLCWLPEVQSWIAGGIAMSARACPSQPKTSHSSHTS